MVADESTEKKTQPSVTAKKSKTAKAKGKTAAATAKPESKESLE